jgi:hypothetical protein
MGAGDGNMPLVTLNRSNRSNLSNSNSGDFSALKSAASTCCLQPHEAWGGLDRRSAMYQKCPLQNSKPIMHS